jgi:hypothetical protein
LSSHSSASNVSPSFQINLPIFAENSVERSAFFTYSYAGLGRAGNSMMLLFAAGTVLPVMLLLGICFVCSLFSALLPLSAH